jgi:hypothetical protein
MRLSRTAYLLAAIFVLALSVTLLNPSRAEAWPVCGTQYTYYDCTHNVVGYALYDCDNNLVSSESWGTVTGSYDFSQNLWCCEPA